MEFNEHARHADGETFTKLLIDRGWSGTTHVCPLAERRTRTTYFDDAGRIVGEAVIDSSGKIVHAFYKNM